MNWLALWVYVLALAVWLGETIFFSVVAAPALFTTFPPEEAGRVVGVLFPRYYAVGYACGAALVATALLLRRRSETGRASWLAGAVLAALSLAACLYAGLDVQPRIAALRPQLHAAEAPPAVRAEFDRLHERAVQLNGMVLIGTLAMAGLLAGQLTRGLRDARRFAGRRWSE